MKTLKLSILILCTQLIITNLVFAQNYTDTFAPAPFSGTVGSFITGTALEGLSYVGTNVDFTANGVNLSGLATIIGAGDIVITSRAGGNFTFNNLWIDTLQPIVICADPEPFSINVAAGSIGTYGPPDGNLVSSVTVESGPAASDFDIFMDDVSVEFMDTEKPDVTINQVGGQADPTNTSPVVFTVVFDEAINEATFTSADVSVGGTATTGTVMITEVAPNDDTTFEVSIVVSADGTVIPTIPAGGVEDSAGNTNTVSTSTDNTVTYDNTDPIDPTPASSSHTVNVWDSDNTIDIQISGAGDGSGSGVDGFEFAWDKSATWTPTETKDQEETWSGATFTATSDGDWYFHIATVDNAGNWTSTQHLGPMRIDTTPPSVPGSLDPSNGSYTTDTSPTLSWTHSTDAGGSGLRTTNTYRVIVTGSINKDYYTANTSYTPTLEEGIFTWKVYARDNAGNASSYTSDHTLTIDATKPDVTINQLVSQSDPTNVSPVVITAVFDEPINTGTFTNVDVNITGTATTGTVTVSEIAPNDGTTFSVSVVISADGTVIADISAGGVEDLAGNTNNVSTSTDNSVTFDATKPDVTINQLVSQSDPTNVSPVVFTVVFDEPINDATFTNADVSVGGTATTGTVTITEVAPNDDTTFEISIVVTADGTVVPTIPAGGVEDPAGNTNTVSTSTDNSVTVETVKPNVTINQGGGQTDPTDTSPVVFTVVFDEAINDATFTNADVNVGGTATTGTVTVTEVAPNDDTTFEVSIVVTAEGTVMPTIPVGGVEDPVGNTNTVSTSTDNSVTLDTTKPDVTINQGGGQTDPTDTSPVVFTVVFDEAINDATFTNADVNVGGTATTGTVTVTEVAPNDDTTFEVSIVVTAEGTVMPTIPAGGVEDPVGNTNTVSTSTDNSVTLDTTKPDVTINQAESQSDPTNASPVLFTAVFDEPINDATFTNADVNVGGTATTGTVSVTEVAPNDDTTFEISIAVTAEGTVMPTIPAGGVEDPGGNTNTVSSSTDNTVTIDTASPTPEITQDIGQTDPSWSTPVNFSVNFGSDVTGFENGDINTAASTAPGTLTANITGGPQIYNVAISGMTGDGLVSITFNAAVVQDLAGNDSNAPTLTDNEVTFNYFVSEIDVQRPAGAGNTKVDGSIDDIGIRTIGTVSLTYTVDNTAGIAALNVTSPTGVNYSNVTGYSVTSPPPTSIAAGTTGTFDIQFVVGIGVFSFDMDIGNNDPDEDPYDIGITGTGIPLPTISGYVRDSGGNPIYGVSVAFSNGGPTATTNTAGFYTADVSYGWSGTSTPSKGGWDFTPANYTYTNVTADLTDQDFVAEYKFIKISGYAKNGSNKAIEGVEVAFSNSGLTATTDVNGYYERTITKGWTGTSTASKEGWGFTPTHYEYAGVSANTPNQNFTGEKDHVTIEGYVKDGVNIGIEGVAVAFSNGGATVITSSSGYYNSSFTNGWGGTATVTKDGWTFTPANTTYSHVTTNLVDEDYIGTDMALGVDEMFNTLPTEFTVLPAYPNPFNPSVTLRYGLENDSHTIIQIYDITGKLITTLVNAEQSQGWYYTIWNGTNQYGEQAPAGLYLSRIVAGNDVKTTKLMLLK